MSGNGQIPPVKLHKIDPGKLKLRELAEIEKLIGHKIAGELQSGDLAIDTMQALLWNELRKIDPAATFEQAGEYDMATLQAAFLDEDEEVEPGAVDPTRATPSEPATSTASPDGVSSKPTPSSIASGG